MRGLPALMCIGEPNLFAGGGRSCSTHGTTPGKIAIGARIVDARTGAKPSTGQLIGRYFGYYVSTIPLFLGLIWVAFDSRKQGWHDKLAGTVVVRDKHRGPEPVRFEKPLWEPEKKTAERVEPRM